jgi:hypothetical protein
VHDFTGTLCAPVAGEGALDTSSDDPVAFSTEGSNADTPPSPSKFSQAASKVSEEKLTQLDIKNFAQRGPPPPF